MTDSQLSVRRVEPKTFPKVVALPIALGLVLLFILVLFPWDSLARRLAWEVSAASGGQVTISALAPALTSRGPVLRAQDVLIEHPAIDRLRLRELEVAPRHFLQWLTGIPTLRIWTVSELGIIDGVLGLGAESSFVGEVHRLELARLPLRLEASAVRLAGQLDGEAELALDPNGTLHGRMNFVSETLVVDSIVLPMAIPFTRAEGVIEILEDGATQIESLTFEGDIIEGELSGEIGLAHRSQSPPIDLNMEIQLADVRLRQLASGTGIPMSAMGEIDARVLGTLDAPRFETVDGAPSRAGAPIPRRARSRKNR